LDKTIREAEITLPPCLLNGALFSDFPRSVMIKPDAAQGSMDLRSGYAVEEATNVQCGKATIVDVSL
jgi:hypothetical protein